MNENILLTNDDGINACGIKKAESLLQHTLPNAQIIVYAPTRERSASSHSMTLSRAIQVDQIDETHFAVHGKPVDCVDIACKLHQFDLVFSGINKGHNKGQSNVRVSGTFSAASHAFLEHQLPSVALSADTNAFSSDTASEDLDRALLATLDYYLAGEFGEHNLLNINFPLIGHAGIKMTKMGIYAYGGPLAAERRNGSSAWYDLRSVVVTEKSNDDVLTDIGALHQGYVSVTDMSDVVF